MINIIFSWSSVYNFPGRKKSIRTCKLVGNDVVPNDYAALSIRIYCRPSRTLIERRNISSFPFFIQFNIFNILYRLPS